MQFLLPFLLAFTVTANPTNTNEHHLNDEVITLDKVEIAQYGMLAIDSAFINTHKLNFLMDNLEEKIYRAPQNAKFNANGEVISENLGITIDKKEFQKGFRDLYYNNNDESLKIPTKAVYPEVDRGMLKEISSRTLGSYGTRYKQSNTERSNNIVLAAEAINNTIIFPGETFSFNGIVGERTTERGYERAPVIVKGELAEDIGGGICQVSSTLFNAVDLKGIQIVERYAHSRRVPYVPPGRDATVSWWGPDFVFKNMYNEPILIRTKATNGQLVVTIHSSETVEYFNGDSD